jgi:hypothetical protein
MLHLLKLAVGPKDVASLRALQAARLAHDPPLRAYTRVAPKRSAEILDGGSIYWVVAGLLCVRQRILAFDTGAWDDGTPCTTFTLDPTLVAVQARAMRPFQGWRYLKPEDAPPDLAAGAGPAEGLARLPPRLRQELQALCLI